MEKLEKEKARSHMLEASSTREEAECAALSFKLKDQESLIGIMQEKKDNLVWENGKLKETMNSLGADLDKSERTVRELQEVQVDLMTQVGEKNKEIESLNGQVENLNDRLMTETSALLKEKKSLFEELAIAQQNIAELYGARKEDVAITAPVSACAVTEDRAVDGEERPPTLPAPANNMVDVSVYNALLRAYENVEKLHSKAVQDNQGLVGSLQEWKSNHDALLLKNAEHVQRIKNCRQEYEVVAKEMQRVKAGTSVPSVTDDELTSLRARLRDMEENHQQVGKSWEMAIEELTSRKEELKKKAITMAEMYDKISSLEEELIMLRQEFTDFQDKHDRVVHEKTAKLDELQHFLDVRSGEQMELNGVVSSQQKEKAKLENTVKLLRAQLDSLKASVNTSDDKSCPVCNTKFPKRILQQDFEQHVQSHFAV